MKNVFFFISFSFLMALIAFSCRDPCKNTNCHSGTCMEGTCSCPFQYEGANCEKETRTKYYGSYAGYFTGGGTSQYISITFEPNSSGEIIMTWGNGQYLQLTSATTFDIPSQTQSSTGYRLDGSGYFSGNQVKMTLYFTINGARTPFAFSGTK